MSDKLQDVVELPGWQKQWIEQNTTYRDGVFPYEEVACIDVHKVRAFLAQYVLCERALVGYVCMGDPDSYSAFHRNQQHCEVCSSPRRPVYSVPAKEEV